MPVPGNSGSVCSSISGPRPGPLLLRQPQVRDSLSLKSSKLCPWMPTFCCFKSGPHLFKCTGHGSTDVSCSPPDDFTSESSRVFGCCRFSNRGGGGGDTQGQRENHGVAPLTSIHWRSDSHLWPGQLHGFQEKLTTPWGGWDVWAHALTAFFSPRISVWK